MRHNKLNISLYKYKVTDMFSEALLVSKARRKDKRAFSKLYLKYFDSLYRFIFFRVNQERAQAEDLTQDVFFRAWDKIDTLGKRELNFRAWIFKIAHNIVIDFYKKSKNNVQLNDNLNEGKHNEEEVYKIFDKEVLVKAINKLSEEHKNIIIMKFIEGFNNKDIAKVLNKNQASLRAMQYRALKKLKEIIKNI